MAKIWQGERSAGPGQFHGGPMGGGFMDSPYSAPPPIPAAHPTLAPGVAYFVRVYGFTFKSMIQAHKHQSQNCSVVPPSRIERHLFVRYFIACICILSQLATTVRSTEPPGKILDLTDWKLTVPYDTKRPRSPDEITQPELATFIDANCFYSNAADDAVILRATCGAETTKNSRYPRCELREMQAAGKQKASWSTGDATTHVMETELAITQVPDVKPHIVCAQIHDDDDDVIMIRLEKKKLFVERNETGDVLLDNNYQLGDRFKLRITAGFGYIRVWYNDELKMDWEQTRQKCYFKTGCYTQSNQAKGDRADAYGEVAIYRLEVNHFMP